MLVLTGVAAAQTPPAEQIPPPAVPPKSLVVGEWYIRSNELQEKNGSVYHLRGKAELESSTMLFRAEDIEYDEDTGDVRAKGNVYFRQFVKNEQMWCDRLEYNTEKQTGKFYEVRGEMQPRIVARRGVLTGNSPFHFEGEWAERIGEKYILYNGWITNCKLPSPWWRMKGPKFEIIPDDHAVAHRGVFLLRKMPIFYAPYFYHSLAKQPRKSGFLTPNIVPKSKRGFMVGLGYYWAMARDYDLTYTMQDYTTHAFTHHVDFRGKPREHTDFDFIMYGVQDRGLPDGSTKPATYSGVSVYTVARSDLGNGWTARGNLNYITSFRFRGQWSESYNELIFGEVQSTGFINKTWSTFTFQTVVSRLQNFQSTEIAVTDPGETDPHYVANAVTIRKLPELNLDSSDHSIWKGLPLWYSFNGSAGMLFRSEPIVNQDGTAIVDRFQTSQFTDRIHMAPHLTGAFHFGDFHFIPSIGFQETFYGESQARQDSGLSQVVGTNIVRSARDFSLDLVFPSLARVYNKKTVFGDKLKHVIEPRATYRYMTGIGGDFNRFIRFDETDLLSNTNELELSLTNRLYAKRGDSVQEIFTWELLQKRYFDPTFGGALVSGERNVFQSTSDLTAYAFLAGPRSTSPVVSLLRASPISGLGVQWQADYDARYKAVTDSALSVDYRWKRYSIFAGHNQVHTGLSPAANQFRSRLGFGDANRRGWNGYVEAAYDYRKAVLQYSTTQVSYNTDCCGLTVQWRRYDVAGLRNESQLRIAFSIANLGTFGTLRKQDRLF